ncbi:MAG: multicopper oxidase domain-containing protein [Candidatus Limnocylindrales bacterium]
MKSPLSRLILLAAVAALVAACATAGGATWTYAPVATPAGQPGASAGPSPVASPATGPSIGTLELEAFDIGYKPTMFTVDTAGTYTVHFKNTGQIAHDFTPDGGTATTVQPGADASIVVTVPAAGLNFKCSVPGHAAAGMAGMIMVKGATSGDSHGGPAPDTGAVVADPNALPYVLYDATAPKVLDGTTHDIDLVVKETTMTVAAGYVQAVWTFNGTVPGPVIRVHIGDTVRIHLKNPITNALSHSVDFHASQVAWNDEMTSIKPGEEKLYEWKADYAGVWMYHCGTAPALHHIANGMYGMVIVEPAGGLKPVDHEFALVQSEWYLGAQGQVTDLAKASAANPAPDFVVFNGVANQYKDNPLKVATGGTVRFFVLDAGPNIDSSFHIVGTIFNSVIKEGIRLSPDNVGHFGSQAVDLSPAQAAIIELTTPEDGLYPIVTHAFNFVGRGALGLLQAGDGDPLN